MKVIIDEEISDKFNIDIIINGERWSLTKIQKATDCDIIKILKEGIFTVNVNKDIAEPYKETENI